MWLGISEKCRRCGTGWPSSTAARAPRSSPVALTVALLMAPVGRGLADIGVIALLALVGVGIVPLGLQGKGTE